MALIWTALAVLVFFVALRARRRFKVRRSSTTSTVDDAAIQQIIQEGTLHKSDDEGSLDLDAAAEAEAEFWSEYWDEPDEY